MKGKFCSKISLSKAINQSSTSQKYFFQYKTLKSPSCLKTAFFINHYDDEKHHKFPLIPTISL